MKKDTEGVNIRRGGTYVIRAAERPNRTIQSRSGSAAPNSTPSIQDKRVARVLRSHKSK